MPKVKVPTKPSAYRPTSVLHVTDMSTFTSSTCLLHQVHQIH